MQQPVYSNTTPITPMPKKKSKVLIVLLVLGVLILLGLILGGVLLSIIGPKLGGYAVEKVLENTTGLDSGYNISGDENTRTFTNGESSYNFGDILPDNWPADVPQYPGSTVEVSIVDADQQTAAATFVTYDPQAQATNTYRAASTMSAVKSVLAKPLGASQIKS